MLVTVSLRSHQYANNESQNGTQSGRYTRATSCSWTSPAHPQHEQRRRAANQGTNPDSLTHPTREEVPSRGAPPRPFLHSQRSASNQPEHVA